MRKRINCLLLAVLLVLSCGLGGCTGYVSHYKAVGFVHSNGADSASMSFYSFEGSMVFKVRSTNGSAGQLFYSGKLENGNATVYYDYNGSKTELFRISSGGEINASIGLIEIGTVYIIVETDGSCQNGAFEFKIE
ncbi:MAG: hypothetical protein IJM90_07440 [Firmicutes bacterium]|nr:hypothetical protein [Bacillota bacterium]